ncbi:MAG: chorismate mutase [Solobacterium sp.]|nr:chorismate mutase [Solobacterium sp.]
MNTLEKARKEIDEADAELVKLFVKRFLAVRDVIGWKMENGMAVQDRSREEEILRKNSERLEQEELRPYFEDWYRKMLEISRRYQEDIRRSADK